MNSTMSRSIWQSTSSNSAVADGEWRIVEQHRLNRARFIRFFAHRPACQVVMEAVVVPTTGRGAWSPTVTRCGFCRALREAVRRSQHDHRADAAALI